MKLEQYVTTFSADMWMLTFIGKDSSASNADLIETLNVIILFIDSAL